MKNNSAEFTSAARARIPAASCARRGAVGFSFSRLPNLFPHPFVFRFSSLMLAAALLLAAPAFAQNGYQKPPKEILEVLHAPVTPQLSLSPARDTALLVEGVRYPPIADLAQPMLRLAGLRINPNTSGPHRPPRNIRYTLKRFADGMEKQIALPPEPYLSGPSWSPDGKLFSFTNTTANAIELWVGDTATATAKKIAGVTLNGVMGAPCDWMPDSRTLLCRLVPAGRGAPPQPPAVPDGPNIQESEGREAPAPTFQDLLRNSHDAALFEYYATSQLAFVDARTGRSTPLGKPAIFSGIDASPDGNFLLVTRVQKPFSYLLPVSGFPREVEVWDRSARVVRKVASLPLAEGVPLGGVPTGPRNVNWIPTEPATLVWVEALDDGNPRKRVAHRDRVVRLAAPYAGEPAEIARTEHRFAGITWGERGDLAILRDFDRNRLWGRAWFFHPKNPSEMRLVWDRSTQDRYNNPGTPLMRRLSNGHNAMAQHGDFIFLAGPGASPEGERPFLDRFHTGKLEAERLFHCAEKTYESVVALLEYDGSKFLTRYETSNDPPNYFIRGAGGAKQAFTNFPDPAPQLRGIKKELVTYDRADGVKLSMTVYLPPDYKPGERRPGVVWAYPREFTDPDVASQVTGSPHRYTTIGGTSHLFFLLRGYVVLDDAAMPVVGDPETVNNTYVEQIIAGAEAAIKKADEMGIVDPKRVGVGGHSYGAFMTANLLAHSDLFRAGIARSGAYNRTLTPFGFQSERRTIWQAPELYVRVSPFLYAHKINEPILLIHGEADNNSGTFPIQSERMYHALKGNGATVRYVTLPHEAHGYAARESIEHTLWEMLSWFDKHVKEGTAVAGNK
jgi:dipeptidyl aminopeptidase/acylaminoacyl peptidase